jgi:hypothetical protein
MAEFEHNGTKIQLTDRGEFLAQVNGQRVRKPSLKAMKGFIDAAAKKAFEPIPVLVWVDWRNKLNQVKGTKLCRVTMASVSLSKSRSRCREGH